MTSFPIFRLNYTDESTLTADKVPLPFAETSWRPTEYFRDRMKNSNGRQSTRYCRMVYSHGRQSTCYTCGNTLTVDRVLATIAEILRRPTVYTMPLDGVLSRPTEYLPQLRKHSDGRQSTRCYRMEYYNGRQSTRHYGMEYSNGRQSEIVF